MRAPWERLQLSAPGKVLALVSEAPGCIRGPLCHRVEQRVPGACSRPAFGQGPAVG